MMEPGILLLIVIGVPVLIVLIMIAGIYNALISARQHVRESWSNVDTELQRRHDLIPNLVSVVKGYMAHERDLLEQITKLREDAERLRPGDATDEQVSIENQLQSALGRLSVRVEAYPDLKASKNFLSLQTELVNTEDRIQSALRFYNGNVRHLNVKVESFPSNLIANMFGFKRGTYFELRSEAARESPSVAF